MNPPNLLHYVWLGDRSPSNLTTMSMKSWEGKGFERILWDEKHLPDLNEVQEKYLETALSHSMWANASNLLRLVVLIDHGGLYVDTDVELIGHYGDFVNALRQSDVLVGFESPFFVNDAVIFGHSMSGLLQSCLDCMGSDIDMEMEFRIKGKKNRCVIHADGTEPANHGGPWLLTHELVKRGLVQGENPIREQKIGPTRVVTPEVFYPKPFEKRKEAGEGFIGPTTLTIHHWEGTWITDPKFK